ncbi:transaldolase [Streptacidiphilus sp. MAP12-33]|uniref:transaldolase family protein n=1 Tax=Streptacidiphilus sp. MAP12-33 TaxID=3156266 RepID=UPI00351227D0
MISAEAEDLLGELASEGVAPWLAWSSPEPPGPDVVRCGFAGVRMPPGASLSAVRAACTALSEAGGSVAVAAVVFDRAAGPDDWVAAARVLGGGVDRPNLLVSIPATKAGIGAIADCLAEGIGVDSTSVVSLGQYREVLDAQLTGLERALAKRADLGSLVASASCEVGPLDSEVNALLDGIAAGTGHDLRDTAGLATARLVYRLREQWLAGKRWQDLRAGRARAPLLLWTGTTPVHVPALVGGNTGHVMSAETAEAAARQGGLRGDTLLGRHEQAAETIGRLAELGVPVDAAAAAVHGRLNGHE